MSNLNQISGPEERDLLVAFFDLTLYLRFSQSHTSQEIFTTFSDYFELVGDIMEGAGGIVVKFIGDAGLIVFGEDDVDRDVRALKEFQDTGDTWLKSRGMTCQNRIKAHFGPVTCGLIGTRTDKRFDIFGETVNTAATLKSNGLAISPQVFRKLDTETRKLFKKHTPPVTYIPVDEPHKNK